VTPGRQLRQSLMRTSLEWLKSGASLALKQSCKREHLLHAQLHAQRDRAQQLMGGGQKHRPHEESNAQQWNVKTDIIGRNSSITAAGSLPKGPSTTQQRLHVARWWCWCEYCVIEPPERSCILCRALTLSVRADLQLDDASGRGEYVTHWRCSHCCHEARTHRMCEPVA